MQLRERLNVDGIRMMRREFIKCRHLVTLDDRTGQCRLMRSGFKFNPNVCFRCGGVSERKPKVLPWVVARVDAANLDFRKLRNLGWGDTIRDVINRAYWLANHIVTISKPADCGCEGRRIRWNWMFGYFWRWEWRHWRALNKADVAHRVHPEAAQAIQAERMAWRASAEGQRWLAGQRLLFANSQLRQIQPEKSHR